MNKLLLLCVGLPLLSFSQGFQVNFQGQQQQAMGGAGTGLCTQPSSVFFNPGGMVFTKKDGIEIGVTPVFVRSKFQDKNSLTQAETTSPTSFPLFAYGTYSIGKSEKIKAGLGIYTPFGSTVEWESGWVGRFALTRLQLQAIFIQPTISYKISDKIGIGAGFVYSTGSVNLQRDIPVMDASGEYGRVELAGAANGFGYNLGVYLQPTEKLSIGVTYRSQVNMSVEDGEATFTVPQGLSTNFPSGTFKSSLPLPQVATLGFGYKATDKLTFVLDVNFVGWKAYDTLAFDYATNTASLVDTKSARNYKNIFAVRGGASYEISPKIAARLGLAYGESPVQDGYVTPETPDANRINFTAGMSYQPIEKLRVDASFFFTKLERTDRNFETNLEGTFKTIALAPGISISYLF